MTRTCKKYYFFSLIGFQIFFKHIQTDGLKNILFRPTYIRITQINMVALVHGAIVQSRFRKLRDSLYNWDLMFQLCSDSGAVERPSLSPELSQSCTQSSSLPLYTFSTLYTSTSIPWTVDALYSQSTVHFCCCSMFKVSFYFNLSNDSSPNEMLDGCNHKAHPGGIEKWFYHQIVQTFYSGKQWITFMAL